MYSSMLINKHPQGDSFFHSDEQLELKLENDHLNKTGRNFKTNSLSLIFVKCIW